MSYNILYISIFLSSSPKICTLYDHIHFNVTKYMMFMYININIYCSCLIIYTIGFVHNYTAIILMY